MLGFRARGALSFWKSLFGDLKGPALTGLGQVGSGVVRIGQVGPSRVGSGRVGPGRTRSGRVGSGSGPGGGE